MKRLEKISPIFDFTVCYVNTKVGEIPEETQFGELAHTMNVKRQASIFVKKDTFLAYVEAKDYNQVLKQATMIDI
jgi:hypothetical protein